MRKLSMKIGKTALLQCLSALIVVACLLISVSTLEAQDAAGSFRYSNRELLILADFDELEGNAAGRSNTGGLFGTWSAGGSQNCQQSFVEEDALSLYEGKALRLTYTVVPSPHYSGWYLFTAEGASKGLNLRGYDRLGFFLKGNTSFMVEVKDVTSQDDGSAQGVAQYEVTGTTDEWQRIEILWYQFSPKDQKTVIDWSRIRQFVIVFSDNLSESEGEIVIDHLYVSRGTPDF